MIGLLITLLAGLSIVLGVFIIRETHNSETIEHLSIAMALAAMLSLMIFDLIPDIRESGESLGWLSIILFIVLGFLLLKLLDLFIPDHEDHEKNHEQENASHIGVISALAIILHNIVEGMTVYSLSLSSLSQGILFAFAISLHNIPMGMMIYSTMIRDRKHRKEKELILGLVSISTLIGGILMHLVSGLMTENLIGALVCLASGMIIYIVFIELLPHVIKTKEPKINLIGILIGFGLVFVSSLLA
jgi:zinc transporter, ZIP family